MKVDHTTRQCAATRQSRTGVRAAVSGLRLVLVFAAAGAMWSGRLLAQSTQELNPWKDPQPARATLAIVGGMLIDGHQGPPVYDAVVLVDGGTIVAVGTRDNLKVPAGARSIDASGYTVMPGLIDAHVHLDFLGHADYVWWHKKYSAIGPRADDINETSGKQLLMAGVTTAIDLGGAPAFQIKNRDRINRGEVVGPRMKVSAGWIYDWTPEAEKAHHRGMEGYVFNVHTAEDARGAILKTIELGADIIKLYTGLRADEVKAVTDEAHKKRLKVTGHASGDADLLMRIGNGQDAVEHVGFNPDNPEVIRELVARRTVIVPTVVTRFAGLQAIEWPEMRNSPRARLLTPPDLWADVRGSLEHVERLPYFGRAALRDEGLQPSLTRVKKLYDAGVRLVIGTDSGTPANFHGDSTRREMELFVRAGIPPAEVIGMATRLNGEYLGMGDRLGTIEAGRLADIIVVDGNPLTNMRDLKNVVYVIKEGVQYKGPGTAPERPRSKTSSQLGYED